MATLQFTITRQGWDTWAASVSIPYTVSYDAAANRSTVTFSQASVTYPGRNGYGTETSSTITVRAGDNPASSGTAALSTSGTSRQEGSTFTGTPNPAGVTVQHSAGAGAKTVAVSVETTVGVYPFSTSTQKFNVTGSGSRTDTAATLYTLSISQGAGTTATVKRGSTALTSGALIVSGETLTFTYSVSPGCTVGTHTVNGTARASGWSWTVAGNTAVVTTAAKKTYTLTKDAGANSTITVKKNGTAYTGSSVTYGDVLTVTFAASTGYSVSTRTINGVAQSANTVSYTVGDANVTIAARAAAQTFTLSISQGSGTTISVKRGSTALTNGASITYGETLSITIGANSGYVLGTHTVNGSAWTSGSYTVSGAVTVKATATAGASSIASCPTSVTTGSDVVITMTRVSPAYYHKVTFKNGNTALPSPDSAFAASMTYTAPHSWFNGTPNGTTLNLTVSVQTYTDSSCTTAVGSPVTRTLTATLNASQKPAIGTGFAAAAATNTGTDAASITGYVQGFSKARLTLTKSKLTMANNATVASYKVVCQGVTKTVSSPGATATVDTNTLTGTSAVTITVTVTDSRGRTASTTLSVTPMACANPTLSGIAVFRCTSTGAASDEGTYYSAKATAGCSSLGGQNSVTLQAQVKAVSASGYGALTTLTSGQASVLGGGLLSTDVSYIVRLIATDALGHTAQATVTIPTTKWAMKFRPDGEGVGFGMVPQHAKALEIPADWEQYFGAETFQQHAQRLVDSRGIAIPANADLDAYTTPGSYYCPDSTTAATLSHAPIINNFRLDVVSSGSSAYANACLQFCWSSSTNSVWMRRKGTVWSDWVHFVVSTGDTDSGWQTATLGSAFTAASSAVPRYRKLNGIVSISGQVSPASAIAGSATEHTIFTLPSGYRPERMISTIMQGSGINKWNLRINTNGAVTFGRYGVSSYVECPTSHFLPFAATFIAG